MRIIVVGAGIFGLTAALELRARGWEVILVEAGEIPASRASSFDISKMVRLEYGADIELMVLMESSLVGWRAWDARRAEAGEGPLFERSGILVLSRKPIAESPFEQASLRALRERRHPVELLRPGELEQRLPAWTSGRYEGAFISRDSGFARADETLRWLAREAAAAGVELRPKSPVSGLILRGDRVEGVRAPEPLEADAVLVAAGAWSADLVPSLTLHLEPTAHPVFLLRPEDPERFRAPRFLPFFAAISETGFYGFPASEAGLVKVATHRAGLSVSPQSGALVRPEDEDRLRAFLREQLPELAEAPVVERRMCYYTDTVDGDFWVGRDPTVRGLTVATGGCGHAFKFAPMLGGVTADAVEGRPHPLLDTRFRWRAEPLWKRSREAARSEARE